jgi:threonine/homoserine/homoserine lactone efflux protein
VTFIVSLESITALALATVILGISPGPAVFATVGRSLSLGLNQTYMFITGIILGDILFSLLAMGGLAALATNYAPVFIALKIFGGGYLIYLGIQSLADSKHAELSLNCTEKGLGLVASGFLLTASNPKDLLFFVGFLPLFMDMKTVSVGQMILASGVIAITFSVTLSFYAIVANYVRVSFKSGDAAVLWLHRIAGFLMMGVGVGVIFF